MALPLQAADAYEDLRTQALSGGRCRSGLAIFLYHGMAQGLTMLLAIPTIPDIEQETTTPLIPVTEAIDPGLVKLLANMVLRIQSEVQHVY